MKHSTSKSAESLTRKQYCEIVHEAIGAKKLGAIRGVAIYEVDGTWVRDNLDVDFVAGGSFARYGYIPSGEVWVEAQGDKDLAATIVHELVECAAMVDGLSYGDAHQVSAEVEAYFRSTWTGDDKPFRAAELFIAEDCEEQASLDADRREYAARKQASSGLVLSRSGYQRYTATWEGPTRTHKVWIGGDATVDHGSYGDGRRQRRKTTWTVKVDNKEIGEAGTLREARTLAERELGIEEPAEVMTVTASDLAPSVPEVRGSPEFVAFMQDYLTVLPFQRTEDAEDLSPRSGMIEVTAQDVQGRDPAIAWPPPELPAQSELPGKQFNPSEPWHLYTVKPGDWYASTKRLIVPEDEYQRLQQPGRKRELSSLGPLKKLPAGTVFDMWRRVPVAPDKLEQARADIPQVSTKAPAERRELEKRILPLLDPEQRKRLQESQDRAKETRRPQPKVEAPPVEFKAFNVTPNGGLANIIEVLKHAPQYLVDQQKDWYKVAHDDAQKLADAKGVPVDLVSGLIAILSPNTLWVNNVFAAEQILSGRGREVIAFREYVDEKAITNWAMKIYPEVFTEKKTLGVMMYLPNIVKAQRALDAFAASGQNTWAVDVAQPVRLEWDTRKQVTAEDTKTKAPAKTKEPKPPKEPKPRKGVISIEEAERKYSELVARGWTARFVKPNARDADKVSWTQGAIVPLGAPFPRDAYGSRLVLNPPFKSGRTVNRKQPDGTRKPVTEDSPKITAFHESILDPDAHAETVVLDGHATNIWRGKPEPLNLTKQPQGEMAQTMREDYRKAARQSKEVLASVGVQIDQNLTPQQLQAVTWVLWSSALKAMPKKEREALFSLKGDDIGGGDFDEDSLEAAEALAHGELSEEPDESETEPALEAGAGMEVPPEPEPPTPPAGGKKPRAPRKPKTPKAGVIQVTAADLVAAWGPGGYELDTPAALESDTLREVRRRRKEDKPTWDRTQLPVTKRQFPPPRDWGPERSWRTTPSPEQKRPKVQLVPPSVDDDDPAKLRLKPNGGYENIVKVLSLATPEEVDYWGRWYLGAAHVVRQMAAQYKLPVKDVAGVVAVLSPGNKWHQNVAVAKQIIEWFLARREHGPWSSPELSGVEGLEFSSTGADAPFFADEDEAAEEAWRKQRKRRDQRPYEFKFKDVDEDDDDEDDEEGGEEGDESGLPEGLEALELKQRKGPKEHPMGFFGPHPSGYPDNVKKALAILGGEDPDAVVTGPKVEVFYQSLLDPDYVRNKLVLDGHAINLWRGEKRPLKGLTAPSATERAEMLADYAKAADAFGLTVQAVQAITWYIWKNVKSPKKLVTAHQRQSVNLAFPAKDRALHMLLADSLIEYPGDFQRADRAYRAWKQQYAQHRLTPKPVWEGGELDAVNGWLSLRGDRRVSGLLEAWERLTVGVRSWADPKVEEAISILRDVPGLEDLRLPEFVLAELSERDYARELGEAEAEAEADDFGSWTEEKHARTAARQAGMLADTEPGESACVAIRVPPALARMWPTDGRTAAGDDSPPHFTVLYLGPIEGGRREELVDIVRQVAGEHRPLPFELARGVSWFENHKGQQIAHKGVHPKTLERLEALHAALRAAVTAAGFEVQHKEPFIAHSTLAYCDDQTYRGSVPEGGWTSREVEVWGWPDDENIPPGSALARAAGRWKVPVALGGEPMIVTAGDLKHAAAASRSKSKRREKRKRFMGETYWLPKDSAFARTRSVDAGDDALEIRLEPDARVLHEGDRDLLDAGGSDAALEDVMKMALEKGYDAVRVKDRLAILNQDAIAERTPKVRPGWHR